MLDVVLSIIYLGISVSGCHGIPAPRRPTPSSLQAGGTDARTNPRLETPSRKTRFLGDTFVRPLAPATTEAMAAPNPEGEVRLGVLLPLLLGRVLRAPREHGLPLAPLPVGVVVVTVDSRLCSVIVPFRATPRVGGPPPFSGSCLRPLGEIRWRRLEPNDLCPMVLDDATARRGYLQMGTSPKEGHVTEHRFGPKAHPCPRVKDSRHLLSSLIFHPEDVHPSVRLERQNMPWRRSSCCNCPPALGPPTSVCPLRQPWPPRPMAVGLLIASCFKARLWLSTDPMQISGLALDLLAQWRRRPTDRPGVRLPTWLGEMVTGIRTDSLERTSSGMCAGMLLGTCLGPCRPRSPSTCRWTCRTPSLASRSCRRP